MVGEIKASLVPPASLIQEMTPSLAVAHGNSGMSELPSYSAPPKSQHDFHNFTQCPMLLQESVLQICKYQVTQLLKRSFLCVRCCFHVVFLHHVSIIALYIAWKHGVLSHVCYFFIFFFVIIVTADRDKSQVKMSLCGVKNVTCLHPKITSQQSRKHMWFEFTGRCLCDIF